MTDNNAMTPSRWARIKELFNAATELPVEARPDYLARECSDDAALLAEVNALLKSHEQDGEFLDTAHERPLAKNALPEGMRNWIGERVGAYRIVELLGSGGMGEVYKAVRDDDQYHAEVAIKVMRADMRGNAIEERFKTERQILAALEHQNIGRLLDGGTTIEGAPYVVMELVQGQPIDQYCETHALNIRQRVELFLQVCAAVNYAHQHLVVHRDLKPNNILVTADGSVKLLDFGIAKLLKSDIPDGGGQTETLTTMRAMTPDYASPEQIKGTAVTTVSDVYSLGVVLYRLLAGRSPYGERKNHSERMADILSDIAPTRPSQVPSNVSSTMSHELKGDLDDILLMALRIEPERRYGSVEQLANDLRNYLAGLPVMAHGNALRYRAGKFIRRHKVELAAAAMVLLSMVAGIVVSVHEARVAQRHFDSVRKLANTLLFQLNDELKDLPGTTSARKLLVSTSLEYLDALSKEAGSDRALQQELAIAFKKVGDIQGRANVANIGDPAGAMQNYARSIAMLESIIAREPSNTQARTYLAESHSARSGLLMNVGNTPAALEASKAAVDHAEALRATIASNPSAAGTIGQANFTHAENLNLAGRHREADEYAWKMVGLFEDLHHRWPDDKEIAAQLSAVYTNAAVILQPQKGSLESETLEQRIQLQRKAMALDEELLTRDSRNLRYQRNLVGDRGNLALALFEKNDIAGAVELGRSAQVLVDKLATDTRDADAKYRSAQMASNLGRVLIAAGHIEEAEALLTKHAEVLKEMIKSADTLRIEYTLAAVEGSMGDLYTHRAISSANANRAAQLKNWRIARDWYQDDVPRAKRVMDAVTLNNRDRHVLEGAAVGLARANAAIAKLEKKN